MRVCLRVVGVPCAMPVLCVCFSWRAPPRVSSVFVSRCVCLSLSVCGVSVCVLTVRRSVKASYFQTGRSVGKIPPVGQKKIRRRPWFLFSLVAAEKYGRDVIARKCRSFQSKEKENSGG